MPAAAFNLDAYHHIKELNVQRNQKILAFTILLFSIQTTLLTKIDCYRPQTKFGSRLCFYTCL